MNTYSQKITSLQSNAIKDLFISLNAVFDVVQYSFWRAKTNTFQAIYYTSGKLLVQGKNIENIAIEIADVILFMTDIREGVTSIDMDIAVMLKRAKKPVIVVCNKADKTGEPPAELYEFYNLGLGEPSPISAANALGIGDVLDRIYNALPEQEDLSDEKDVIKVAIIGKPNVRKIFISK